MATYQQENSWREDGYGKVTIRFVVSNTYVGLFSTTPTIVNIFDLEDVKKELKTKVGGSIDTEMGMTINEAKIYSTLENTADEFVKDVADVSIIRFAAIFVNTTGSSPNDLLFTGIIQPEYEGEDLKWFGDDYDTDVTPITKWKFTSKPYSEIAFNSAKMEDLIAEISDAWINTNVNERIAYFSTYVGADLYQVYANNLCSLDTILRELADQQEAYLSANGFGTINIAFDKSAIDGRWHPARWHRNTSALNRYISIDRLTSGITTSESAFTVYDDDYTTLKIDPDGSSSMDNQIWLSWALFKEMSAEPRPKNDDNYRVTRFETFMDFLDAVAFNFGCYLETYWSDSTTVHVKFRSRASFVATQIYLRTALPNPKRKITADDPDDKTNDIISYANYLADEGPRLYFKGSNTSGETDYHSIGSFDPNRDGTKIFLTISPTFCYLEGGKDMSSNYIMGRIGIPHNHCFAKNTVMDEGFVNSAHGLHTAIYLRMPMYSSHPNSEYEPSSYWTPAAKLSLSFDEEDKQYDAIVNYLKYLNATDEVTSTIEYNIDVPFYYGFSENSDGSSPDWKLLNIGNKIVIDEVEYIIKSAKWSLAEPMVKLVLIGTKRFSASNTLSEDFELVAPTLPSDWHSASAGKEANKIVHLEAAEDIDQGNIVSLKSDGTVEIAKSLDTHYDRYYGMAISDAEAGEDVTIMRYGEYYNEDYSFAVGPVYLRNIGGETFNVSQTVLSYKNLSEDMAVSVARAINENTLSFDLRNQPLQIILTIEDA